MNNSNNQNFLRYPAFNLTEQDVAEYLSNFEQRQDRVPGQQQSIPNGRVYFNPVGPYQPPHPWAMYYPPPFMSNTSYHIPPPNILSANSMVPSINNGAPSPPESRRPSGGFLAMPPPPPHPPHRSDSVTLLPTSAPPSSTDDITPEPRSPYQIIYRNLFHTINCKLDKEGFEGSRIYVLESVGYSGNAKRFKKRPEKGEQALFLNCTLADSEGKLIAQCLACHDYFDTQKYFKANPECMGKVALIKNNAPIVVEHGEFKLLVKIMCCCAHHNMDAFYFSMTLSDPETSHVVLSCNVPICVKQWRKSNQKKEDALVILT